eukprot:gnl/TRDRNA2_/TRDRNA2_128760_c0_seq1.p1 gnl/TRDRNA2_/TRDRNA2_128760_c0~~gnl/TRDRNA2_/TRDRNA2_128760_c0_seq1.p1  ORF type:complete len:321 (+),score=38.10 gnl/TRDRNA2_/TRDRNA2_128760_c0_seq1:29-991(+)
MLESSLHVSALSVGEWPVHLQVLPLVLLLLPAAATDGTNSQRNTSAAAVATGATIARTVVVCERQLAAQCGDVDAFAEPVGGCRGADNSVLPMPPSAMTLFPGTEPAELALISRSLRFGRILWCLARRASTAKVLEFFAGTGGGSTLLLAHGLEHHLGVLYSFEREASLVSHGLQVLLSQGLRAEAVSASGSLLHEPGAWLLHGEPMDADGVGGPLRTLCDELGPIDLVVLDPQGTDLASEWPVVEAVCKPRLVAIHNTNVPRHAGWIRNHLLAKGSWHELLSGWHPSVWEYGEQERWWSVLWRAGGGRPGLGIPRATSA